MWKRIKYFFFSSLLFFYFFQMNGYIVYISGVLLGAGRINVITCSPAHSFFFFSSFHSFSSIHSTSCYLMNRNIRSVTAFVQLCGMTFQKNTKQMKNKKKKTEKINIIKFCSICFFFSSFRTDFTL